MLLGFVPPSAGAVLVDGRDLASFDPESWRRQIAWVPQHPHLFAGTVADNVRLARPEATDAEIRAALAAAHALDFAEPGLVLGEGGAGLSAGQRLALARAVLADRPLVLLDEPTADLDGESEAAVVEAVRSLATGRTVLLVAHRPALLAIADRRVHLDVPHEGREVRTAEPRRSSVAAPADPRPCAVQPPPGPGRGKETRPRLGLAVLLGSLALGCAVALLATSGWLISRASEMPPALYLLMAVASVRAFGIGRSVFRFAERLVAHNAVLKALGGVRTAVYRRLEQLAPAALPVYRRGDLLVRLVSDVDAVQDHHLRWRLPAAVGVVVSLGASAALGAFLPAAGAVLAVGLLLAGAVVPALASRISGRAERQQSPARGELTARVVDTFTGTAELIVAGALPARLARARAADLRLTGLTARSAATAALSAGLIALITGLTVAATAALGIQGVAGGALPGVCLAVVVLTPSPLSRPWRACPRPSGSASVRARRGPALTRSSRPPRRSPSPPPRSRSPPSRRP